MFSLLWIMFRIKGIIIATLMVVLLKTVLMQCRIITWIQKCYKLHGYPPGYIPGYKSNPASPGYQPPTTRPTFGQPFQPREQFSSPRPPLHAVANVMTGPFTTPSVYNTPAAVSTSIIPQNSTVPATPLISQSLPVTHTVNNVDLKQMNNEQIQSLLQQLTTHVKDSEHQAPSSSVSSITEHGAMDPQSSSGTISFPSTSLRYENNKLTFQHQCLSTLYSHLPHGSWIIDSGATSHVCSDLGFFNETVTVSSVTVSLPNDTRVDIMHCGRVHLSESLVLHDVLHESIQGLMIGRGVLLHNLYILQLDASSPAPLMPATSLHFSGSLAVDGHLWHQRLGHPSSDKLKVLSVSQENHIQPSHNASSSSSLIRPSVTNTSLEAVTTGTTKVSLNNARPKRPAKAPGWLSDYHCSLIHTNSTQKV
ncbi:unnamed protein product, partial [Arabidopsis halleri]